MLIDLPIEDLKLVMQDFPLFNRRVQQASELIDKLEGESMSIFSGQAGQNTVQSDTLDYGANHFLFTASHSEHAQQ